MAIRGWIPFLIVAGLMGQERALDNRSLDDLTTERALALFQSICEAQGKALWDHSLCGPMVIANGRTRSSVANRRDPDGKFVKRGDVWVGQLPERFDIANTAIEWGEGKWTMVGGPLPVDPFLRLSLVAHEAFHRIQGELGLNVMDYSNAHLDTETGRLWLRLELRALARALRATEEGEMRRALTDALLFRERRQSLHQGSREREDALERQEGLAEYTGVAVALNMTRESVDREARRVEQFEDSDTYARSFAYRTGPALGLLLDRTSPGWRKQVGTGASLQSLLRSAAHFQPPTQLANAAESAAARYGYRAVAEAEHEREVRHQELLNQLTKRFIDGPTLLIPATDHFNRSFDPSSLVTFGTHGTHYPAGVFRGTWGKMELDFPGAILSNDYRTILVVAPASNDARPLTGPGWKLELAPGWKVRSLGVSGKFELYDTSGGSGARQ